MYFLSAVGLLSSAWGCPSIPLMSYSESVPETTEVGTIILTVLASANPGETLTFLIIDNPSEERSFEIDATGNLTLSRTLDYETRSSDYVFDVFASISGSCSRSVGVTISIINENDNAPHCAQQVLYSSVQENSTLPVDNVVALSCTDGDEMGLTYQFTSGNENGIFSIDSDGKVSTIEVLDYESQSSFELNVLVLDRGFALQYNTTVKIFVSVEPVNEFSPEFANTTFEFYVYESASLGSIVGQASAVDQDSRADGTIFYSLPPGGDSEVFTICSENGYVYLRRSLDFEVTTSYEFEVIASDSSLLEGNRLTSTATILVHVRDSNDHTPAFTQSIYYVQVPEEDETETGSNITQLTCADSDSGSNQELTYTIISGNEQGQFGISSSGQITFESTSLLDFDQGTRLFELTVKCMDAGLPRRSAEVLVVLEVTGVNDFEPNPSSTEYVLNVAEDTPPGTSIGQVQANDQDMGLAGVLSYSIASCPSGLLHIDPVDGTVYLMGTLDYEAGLTEITCVASVRDSQQPIKAREVDLIIAIVDINDEPPTCDAPIKLFSIGEDSLPGYIITFFCEDVDSSTLQYSIPSGGPFNVNPNGNMIILTLQSQLDYETQSAYSFPIEVSDGDFTTVVGVYISVVDTNEHAPTFSSEHFQCNISESAQVGTLVCETIASDTDAGTLRYRVINSTENGTFVIDPVTGAIMLSASLDYEKDTEYTLIVEVSDSGSPVRSSLAVVQITVRDENDHAPLMKPLYFTAVSENATLGASLAFLDCQDVDSGNNGIMALEIASTSAVLSNGEEFTVADNTFVIDSTSGHLNLNELLDYETFQLYTVQVVCKDHGLPSLSAVSTVTIEVLPVNEFVPSFELQRYTVSIPESSSMGTSILQVKASDNDFSEDGTIAFSLNSTQYLYINPETGIVTVVKPIDCARGTVYDYSVEARDGGSPMLSAEVELEVHIINCSLGSLVPDSTFHTANVSESAPVGTVVFSVSCTGSRESLIGDGYSSHYAMTPTDSSPFEVDTLTGEVSVSFPLDYETSTSYLLLLQCYDPSGSLDAASSISAYIAILPENEHPPKFSVGLYTVQVHEDVSLSSSILSIQAYDMDGGEDGSITYSIQQAEQTFSIDPISGKIYLTDFLDFETTEQIDFQVFAEDNPRETGSKRYSHVNVTVKVLDSNDHRPECERTFYHATTSQLTTVGTRLVNVNCSDKDQGQNAELEYRISDDIVLEFFAVNSTTGELTLLQTLNPDIAVVHLVPIAVQDKGNSSLTSTVVVIVDVQDPLNLIEEDEGSEVDNEDAASQTELEGRGNSVKMVLKDLSLQLVSIVSGYVECSTHPCNSLLSTVGAGS